MYHYHMPYHTIIQLALTCQLFAPSTLRVTFETEGQGKFTKEEINEIVARDASGKVIELRLPQKVVLIANHQVRVFYPDM